MEIKKILKKLWKSVFFRPFLFAVLLWRYAYLAGFFGTIIFLFLIIILIYRIVVLLLQWKNQDKRGILLKHFYRSCAYVFVLLSFGACALLPFHTEITKYAIQKGKDIQKECNTTGKCPSEIKDWKRTEYYSGEKIFRKFGLSHLLRYGLLGKNDTGFTLDVHFLGTGRPARRFEGTVGG